MNTILRSLLHLLRRSRHDADLREEIETHRALRQAALEREFSEVYRAHDSRLKRDVAIKVSNASSPSVLPAKPVRLRLSTTPTSVISTTLDPTIWSWYYMAERRRCAGEMI